GRVQAPVFPHRIGFSTAMSRQFALDEARRRRAAFFLEFLNTAETSLGAQAAALHAWGEDLRAKLRARYGHALGIVGFCEQLPDDRNTVTLDQDVRDHH